MPNQFDPATIQALYDGGHLSPETYALASNGAPNSTPAPDQVPQPAAAPTPDDTLAAKRASLADQPTVFDPKLGTQVAKGEPGFDKAVENASLGSIEDANKQAISDQDAAKQKDQAALAQYQKTSAEYQRLGLTPPAAPSGISTLPNAPGGDATPKRVAADGELATDAKTSGPSTQDQLMGSLLKAPDQIDHAYSLMQAGISSGAAAGMKQAAAEGAYIRKTADTADQMLKEKQAREGNRQSMLNDADSSLKASLDDYQKTHDVDPNRVFHSMDTGQKITTALSLMLGAFGGAGTPGGKNQAMDYLNDEITRDIAAQKDALAKKGDVYKMKQGAYSDMLKRFGDDRVAEDGARVAMLDNAQLRLKGIAAQYKGPQVAAEAMQKIGELEIQKQQSKASMYQNLMKTGAFMQADDMTKQIQRLPNESDKVAAMKEMGDLQKHESAMKNLKDSFDTIRWNNTALGQLSPNARSQVAAAIGDFQSYTSEMFGGKSEQEFKIIQSMLPKITDDQATADHKWQMIQGKFNSQLATPTLTGFGIRKPPISMKAPVRRT